MAGREPQVEKLKILAVFMDPDSDPALTASEVSEEIDLSRQGAEYRLKQLVEDGLLETKSTGRDRIYWIEPEGQDHYLKTVSD